MSEAEATDTAKRAREEEETPAAAEGAEPPVKIIKTEEETTEAPAAEAEAAKTDDAEKVDNPPAAVVKTEEAVPATDAAATAPAATTDATTTPAVATAEVPSGLPPAVADPAAVPPGVPLPGDPAAPVSANPYAQPGAAAVAAAVPDANAVPMVEETGEVSSMYVGRVIGKGGEMIRDLQARSGCRIDVDQSVPPGQPRIITYRGTRKTVDFAKQLVTMLCHEHVNEAELPLGEAKREIMAVPATSVGKIIGRGGEMIRELQSRSHAKIQVDHNNQGSAGLPSNQKRLTITGTDPSVVKAKEMVNFLVANPMMDAMQGLNMLVEDKMQRGGQWGSGPPYLNMPNMGQGMVQQSNPYGGPPPGGGYDQGGGGAYGAPPPGGGAYGAPPPGAYGAPPPQQGYGGPPPQAYGGAAAGGSEVEMFFAAKNFMGRIIGQKGVTINDLQKRSGCDIQINQDVAHGQDCEISIRGSRQGIETAKQMLREIIEVGPNHPYAGGGAAAPAYGGGGGGGGYGQPDPYAQQQQGGYGGAPAYGGYQQAPPQAAYGQPDPYAQQQPAYGGAGGYQQPAYGGAPAYGQPPGQQAYGGYAAPPPGPPAGASPWKSAQAADGQTYYYNEKTGETQWDKPAGMP